MKYFAIGLVVIILAGALYVHDRVTMKYHTIHLADSLDSINSSMIHYFVDSSSRLHDQNYNRRIIQLKRHIDFQDHVILNLSKRLDSLIQSQHGR